MELRVEEQEAGARLDLFVHARCPHLSRTRAQALIREELIRLNGLAVRPGHAVRAGDRIDLTVPEPEPPSVQAEEIPLDLVFEDADLLVVNKQAGMTVHPAPGSWTGTLVNALLHHCQDLSGINGVLRPGIVHRLDKQTSGLLIVAKNDVAHRGLAAQLEGHRIRRGYVALAWGRLAVDQGTIEAPVGRHPRDRQRMAVVEGGRRAITRYHVRERFAFLTLLDLALETGRTHQIRVHLQHLGHPVFGDPVYGGRTRAAGLRPEYRGRAELLLGMIDRQALHARELRFRHPVSGAELLFTSPLPPDLDAVIAAARGGSGPAPDDLSR
ncbi:MAG: RluA family pseudouridine synthase [Candidatus Latescibacterota bacterium]|jgi:23S rRNA pseudouridine1911/1915/1917 synthase